MILSQREPTEHLDGVLHADEFVFFAVDEERRGLDAFHLRLVVVSVLDDHVAQAADESVVVFEELLG